MGKHDNNLNLFEFFFKKVSVSERKIWAPIKATQRTNVVENYILFPSVHKNSLVLRFEMPASLLFWFCYSVVEIVKEYFYCLYSVVNVGSVFTEAQPGSTLTALCFEIAYSLLRKIL